MNIFKKFNKLDTIKKIFKSFTIYTGANFLNQGIPFLLLPILTRVLSSTDYGMWATFTAMAGIISVIISMGTEGAVAREYVDRHKKGFNFTKYTSSAIFINLTTFLILSIIIFFAKNVISWELSVPSGWLLLLPVIGISGAIYGIPNRLFVFKKRPLPFAGLKLSNTFIEMTLSIFLVIALGLGWRGRVLGFTITKILFLAIGILFLFRDKLFTFRINFGYMKRILHYGIPIVFHALGIAVVAATDRFFLNRLVGLSATGLYAVGYSVAAVITFFVGAFSLAWIPIFYEKLNAGTYKLKVKLVKGTYTCFVLITLSAILLIIIAPFGIKFFVGKKFIGSSQFIFWLALANAFHGMYIMVAAYILYQKRTYLLAIIAMIIITVNIIFNYFLIKLNGAIGAAQATFLTFLARFILVWYFSNKVYPMPWFSFRRHAKA